MSKRRSVHIAGFRHVNPIPNASRIGNLVMSGVIVGVDPTTGKIPTGLEEQCANMFAHVRSIVEAAGSCTDDIIKMTVWLRNPSDREALNREWLKMFPDEASRPARHAMPIVGDGPALVQCDLTAVVDER